MKLFLITLKENYVRNVEILRCNIGKTENNCTEKDWVKHYEEVVVCQVEAHSESRAIKNISEKFNLTPISLSAYEIVKKRPKE